MQTQNRLIKYMNQWFLNLQNVLKQSNIRIIDRRSMTYSLLTGHLYAYTNLFSLLGFSSGSFSVWSSSKSKLDIKYDFKEFHCISVMSKHFPPCRYMIDYLPNFVVLKVMNSISCFLVFKFCQSFAICQ